jgi:hypothetical protein
MLPPLLNAWSGHLKRQQQAAQSRFFNEGCRLGAGSLWAGRPPPLSGFHQVVAYPSNLVAPYHPLNSTSYNRPSSSKRAILIRILLRLLQSLLILEESLSFFRSHLALNLSSLTLKCRSVARYLLRITPDEIHTALEIASGRRRNCVHVLHQRLVTIQVIVSNPGSGLTLEYGSATRRTRRGRRGCLFLGRFIHYTGGRHGGVI